MTWGSRTIALVRRGTVESRGDANPLLRSPGDYVLVFRGFLRLALMACPDGCGEAVVVNLDPNAGPAWRLYSTKRGMTLYPSVWRDTGCRSHFIVWNDRVLLFGGDDDAVAGPDVDPALVERVAVALNQGGEISFRDIAENLDEIPWAVLDACEALVSAGRAKKGSRRGSFRARR